MNQVAVIDFPLPVPTPSLSMCFSGGRYASRDPEEAPLVLAPLIPRPSDVAEAQRLLALYQRQAQQPTREAIAAWLRLLARRVAKRPDENEIQGRIDGLCDTCAHLPAQAFSQVTLAAASAAFDWFPSVKSLTELLTEASAPFLDVVEGLRRVAAYRPSPASPAPVSEPITDEMREHVRRVGAERRAELAEAEASKPGAVAIKAKPAPVSDGAMLAGYEAAAARARAEGRTDAAVALEMRVTGLRAKIAREAMP